MNSPHRRGLALGAAFGLLVLTLSACADGPTAITPGAQWSVHPGSDQHQPVELEYWKCFDPAAGGLAWAGEVSGDFEGALATRILDEPQLNGHVMYFRSTWTVTAGDQSFVADLVGSSSSQTGRAVLSGTILRGYLAGARVYVDGQITDPERSCFEGTLRIMPATGG